MLGSSMSEKTVRFVVVGSACAALYFLLCLFFRAVLDWRAFAATGVAYAICFCLGYLGQKKFAFRSTSRHTRSLPRYAALQATVAIVTAISTEWLTGALDLSPLYMSVFATGMAGVVSFFASYYWVFREPSVPLTSNPDWKGTRN
jgi:putative flippase GtrA